jgi:hypothetical protein
MAGKITRARQARPYRRLQSGYPLAGLRRDGFLDELCAAVTRERGRTDEIWHKARAASPHAAAQTRIISVARIGLDSRKSVRPFKGIICDDISEFESYMSSQPVRSPSAKM